MNFFDRIFGKTPEPQPAIRFGRFTDSYRTDEQNASFEAAATEFENELFLQSYRAFFNYLYHESEDNIHYEEGENGEVKFEFYQGSKRVTGYANARKFYAESRLAKAKTLQSSFMRRLLEENFELKYSRFALTPDNEIAIVFDSFTTDGSPYKLYAALKELATHSDKHDDILIDEFQALEPVDVHVRRALPEAEKEIKYNFIVREISAAFREMDEGKLNADQYGVAFTYLLLHLCYKLDYLTKPEGFMMETLERAHRLVFAKDGKNAAQKNQVLRKELQKLLDRPKEKFFKEMYEVRSTFGITMPVDHQQVALIIEQELPNMKWYHEHGHEKVALAIPGFVAGRCLFYFAPQEPDKEYFHLLLQIMEPEFFGQLGFKTFLSNGVLDEKAIKNAIRRIADAHEDEFTKLKPDLKKLVFSSVPQFAESFLWMVHGLDLSKSE